eukprot:CAMPEP_0170631374 /NCGR_PEP_ID=MMETSP0224-20130122/34594_1 /TAXON_ID=285029 /ORGANISM="Togula jolla, Strain CCCM 725" /LENGTH=270 /DNA_ID=CAMNT_0010959683 /DNA_START=160 /DNA_END=970 /DNA_ORIENTATION=-
MGPSEGFSGRLKVLDGKGIVDIPSSRHKFSGGKVDHLVAGGLSQTWKRPASNPYTLAGLEICNPLEPWQKVLGAYGTVASAAQAVVCHHEAIDNVCPMQLLALGDLVEQHGEDASAQLREPNRRTEPKTHKVALPGLHEAQLPEAPQMEERQDLGDLLPHLLDARVREHEPGLRPIACPEAPAVHVADLVRIPLPIGHVDEEDCEEELERKGHIPKINIVEACTGEVKAIHAPKNGYGIEHEDVEKGEMQDDVGMHADQSQEADLRTSVP